MKKIVLFTILLASFSLNAQENEETTYYLIRHAEKDRSNESNINPELTKKGLKRAKNWSVVFEHVNFDAIYSTKFNRTIQTAQPTAAKQQLEIQFYNPNHLYDDHFRTNTKGKTVLVVGHSNTTPQFVNDILGKYKYEDIDDLINDNLYIVTITAKSKQSLLLKIPLNN